MDLDFFAPFNSNGAESREPLVGFPPNGATNVGYNHCSKDELKEILTTNDWDTYKEITITFGKKLSSYLPDTRVNILSWWLNANKEFFGIKHLLLVHEYGDNLRLHFHGLVKCKRIKDYDTFRTYISARIGRNTISKIRNMDKYKEYLLKEQEEFTYFLEFS